MGDFDLLSSFFSNGRQRDAEGPVDLIMDALDAFSVFLILEGYGIFRSLTQSGMDDCMIPGVIINLFVTKTAASYQLTLYLNDDYHLRRIQILNYTPTKGSKTSGSLGFNVGVQATVITEDNASFAWTVFNGPERLGELLVRLHEMIVNGTDLTV